MNTKEIEKPAPDKELVVKILENEYTIKLPDTGQFIDIELKKVQYGRQMNDGLIAKASEESIKASFLIDMAATFNILIPELEKDINTPSLFRLTQLQSAKLLDVYLKVYYPWAKEWQTVINNSTIEKEEDK